MAAEYHRRAEELMIRADSAHAGGQTAEAEALYAEAADLESAALAEVPPARTRTRGILAVSSVALLRRANRIEEGIYRCAAYLAERGFEPQTRAQLFQLMDELREASLAPASSGEPTPTVEWILRGPQIAHGSAPSDVVVSLLEHIGKYGVRILEYLVGVPLRQGGKPNEQISSAFDLRVTQPQAGSFRFSTRFTSVAYQLSLFDQQVAVTTAQLDALFSEVLDLAAEGRPESLEDIVRDSDYRVTFMRLVRTLVPDGKRVSEIEVLRHGEPVTILTPQSGRAIDRSLQRIRPPSEHPVEQDGVLRALDLDHRSITLQPADGKRVTCKARPDAIVLEDIVGPLVNRRVRVYGDQKGKSFLFTDIEELEDGSEQDVQPIAGQDVS